MDKTPKLIEMKIEFEDVASRDDFGAAFAVKFNNLVGRFYENDTAARLSFYNGDISDKKLAQIKQLAAEHGGEVSVPGMSGSASV